MQTYRDRVGDLKLRASYGLNGNQQDVGDYDFMTTYGTWANAYGFNGVPVQGLMFTMGNELLTWETAKTFNIGVDATFFKNTLSVNFDYFYKRTEDILLSPIVPEPSAPRSPRRTAVSSTTRAGNLPSTITSRAATGSTTSRSTSPTRRTR